MMCVVYTVCLLLHFGAVDQGCNDTLRHDALQWQKCDVRCETLMLRITMTNTHYKLQGYISMFTVKKGSSVAFKRHQQSMVDQVRD